MEIFYDLSYECCDCFYLAVNQIQHELGACLSGTVIVSPGSFKWLVYIVNTDICI